MCSTRFPIVKEMVSSRIIVIQACSAILQVVRYGHLPKEVPQDGHVFVQVHHLFNRFQPHFAYWASSKLRKSHPKERRACLRNGGFRLLPKADMLGQGILMDEVHHCSPSGQNICLSPLFWNGITSSDVAGWRFPSGMLHDPPNE